MSNPLADLEKVDVFLCIGTNMTECHPVAATRLKKSLARGEALLPSLAQPDQPDHKVPLELPVLPVHRDLLD